MDLASHDVATLERMARRRRRTWLAAIVGNALLVVVLVGGPWLRGRTRAREARASFGALAACLWNATPDPRHGLTLPPDDLAVYADASRDPEWPRRCVALTRFGLEPAFWLFPETRVAEADVVRATRVVAEEIEATRPSATVASRPRLAMLRLSAALAVYAESADAFVDLDASAIELPEARSVMPERVPLQAAEDASLEVYAHADGIELLALDGRGLSWVRVRGGRHDGRRMRRPSTLRGTARHLHESHLLWWTDPERCAPDCSRRAMGWASLGDDAAVLPDPRWLGAHPVADDAFAVSADGLRVVALGEPPELRRFELASNDANAFEDDEQRDAPAAPSERVALEGALDPHVDADGVWWSHEGVVYEHRETTRALGEGSGWVQRAGAWVWAQSGEIWRDGERVATMPGTTTTRLVAADRRAWLFAEREGTLNVATCEDTCGEWTRVADAVASWDATREDTGAWVAYAVIDDPAIRVRELNPELGEPTLPAPCFDTDVLTGEPSGMCGRPTFGTRDQRVFLVAREGSDAWVIERENGPWRPLTGLR